MMELLVIMELQVQGYICNCPQGKAIITTFTLMVVDMETGFLKLDPYKTSIRLSI
jgi:hypothetical protein